MAAEKGHVAIVKRLLAKNSNGFYEFPDIIKKITALVNYALLAASEKGHIEVIKTLLAKNCDGSYEFPDVIQKISINNNYALRVASKNGHSETSYTLAKVQWPNGVKDIPRHLSECIPEIRKGEIIVNTREESLKESAQLFRWLQVGYIPTSRQDLYLPPRLSSKELQETTTLDFDVINIVNKYAGTERSVDTSRPTKEELITVSGRGINILRVSSSLMSSLEKARIEREGSEHTCNERDMPPYKRHRFN